jgi:hypothetical protein
VGNYKRHLIDKHGLTSDDEIGKIMKKTPGEIIKFKCIKCGKPLSSKQRLRDHKLKCKKNTHNDNANEQDIEDKQIITINDNKQIQSVDSNNINLTMGNDNNNNIANNNCNINSGNIITVNNVNNDTNIQNKITIVNLGEEKIFDILYNDMDYVVDLVSKFDKEIETGKKSMDEIVVDATLDMYEKIHCNKEHSENHNIYIANKNPYKPIIVYTNDSWSRTDNNDVIIRELKRIKIEFSQVLKHICNNDIDDNYEKDKIRVERYSKLFFESTVFDKNKQYVTCINAYKIAHKIVYNNESLVGITYHNSLINQTNIIKIKRPAQIFKTLTLTKKQLNIEDEISAQD